MTTARDPDLRIETGLGTRGSGTRGQRQGRETRAEGRKISAESDLEARRGKIERGDDDGVIFHG